MLRKLRHQNIEACFRYRTVIKEYKIGENCPMIKYKSGYKYVLAETFGINIPLYHQSITTPFIILDPRGNLVVKEGYAWDGATLFPDLEVVKRGSLVHDALCQLLRLGLLHSEQLNLINSIFVDCGFNQVRYAYNRLGNRKFCMYT